jgi:hypothetical protein
VRFLPDKDERAYSKARRRLRGIRSLEVQNWGLTSLWAVQEGLEHLDRAALQQARTGVVGILASIDTLLDRVE